MTPNTRQRIGILGGTFNPVHLGHLILGQTAVETYDLFKVLFMPCHTPPHKHRTALLPAATRLEMVQQAVEGDLRFEACDLEVRRGGISYAVDTVAALTRHYPESDLYFIIGADTLAELHLWKDVYTLLAACTFVTFGRPGFDLQAMAQAGLRIDPPWSERLLANLSASRLVEISSSDIRHRIAEGLSIRYLVPPAVEMYIMEHGLYQP